MIQNNKLPAQSFYGVCLIKRSFSRFSKEQLKSALALEKERSSKGFVIRE